MPIIYARESLLNSAIGEPNVKRTYTRHEEQPMPKSGATLLDLALSKLLLQDEDIDSKALYYTPGLRRELRDYVIELRAENVRLRGEVAELKADELTALAKANDFYWNHDGES